MKLTPDTQIVHLKGIWISTSLALRQCNIRTLQDLSLVNLATTPSEIHQDQLVMLLEAAEVAGVGGQGEVARQHRQPWWKRSGHPALHPRDGSVGCESDRWY